jgi:outer membrane immunogenic protein
MTLRQRTSGGPSMRRLLPILLATTSLSALAAEAGAADLRQPMPTKAPAPAVVRTTTWTGCYIGANVGYGRMRNEYSPVAGFIAAEAPDQTVDGIVGGGQVGCDLQFDPFVVGIQGMFDGTGMSGTGDPYTGGKDLRIRVPWLATLTGRVGVAVQNNLLLYVKGGAAWARTNFDFFNGGLLSATGDITRTGWTIGGGLEWRFAPNWSVFVEYGHLSFGNRAETFQFVGSTTRFPMNVRENIDLVLVGVNYRFGGALIAARY